MKTERNMAAGLTLSEQFIALFNSLKEAAGNSPERVPVFYKDSKAIREALGALHNFLERTDLERRAFHSQKVVIPRAAGFEAAWKEYDAKWRFRVIWPELSSVSVFSWEELEKILDEPAPSRPSYDWKGQTVEREPTTTNGEFETLDPETEDTFDPLRHDGGAAIQLGIEQLEASNPPGFFARNSCRLAIGAYDYLTETIGLNVRDVFQRWRRVPVVFMPTHVSNSYGSNEKGSLLQLLDDAVRAYVFGAPAAAIAMCRAALETVLRQHYGRGKWEDEKLGQLVVLASRQYDFVQEKRITPLVQKANRILHNYAKADRLSEQDDRTILNFLKTVKFLIQRAPKR